MLPEAQLVADIREVARLEVPERTPEAEELAEQYADICTALNERLIKCGDFLDKGMRSEAVHEVSVPPPLIELVDVLNFREVSKWRNMCEDLGMRVFPLLRLDIVDRLREASATEGELDPLLREYRRQVHKGSRDEQIRLLREIRTRDSDNPVWAENLAPLEEAQYPELEARVEEALDSQDLPLLADLQREITHPQRTVEVADELVARVAEVLDRDRRRDHAERIRRAGETVREAFAARRENDLDAALEAWHALLESTDVKPEPDLECDIREAGEWLDAERKRRQEDDAFRDLLASLTAEVDREFPDSEAVRTLYRRLQATGRDIPDDVPGAVSQAIARVEDREQRRRRSRATLVTVVSLVAVIALLGAAVLVMNAQSTRKRRSALRALVEAGDYRNAADYLERLKQEKPKLFFREDIQQYARRVQEALNARDERLQSFEVVMNELEAIRANGFEAPEARVAALVDRARDAAPDAAGRTRVAAWENARMQALRNRQQRLDDRFRQAVAVASRRLEMERQRDFGALDQEAEAIQTVKELLEQALLLREEASARLHESYDQVETGLRAWAAEFKERRDQAASLDQDRQRMVLALDQALPDLELFLQLSRGFIERFPQSPRCAGLRRVLADEELLDDALTAPAQRGSVRGSIWYPERAALGRAKTAIQALPDQVLGDLVALPGMKVFVVNRRPRNGGEWEAIYYQERLFSREGQEDGVEYTMYWCDAFRTSDTDPQPWVERIKFSTTDYEVETFRDKDQNRVPQARFLKELQAMIQQTRDDDVALVETLCSAIADAARHPDMPQIPKAWIIRRLAAGLESVAIRPVPELVKLRRDLGFVAEDLNWMHTKGAAIVAANRRIREALAEIPEMDAVGDAIQQQWGLMTAAVTRPLKLAGRLVKNQVGAYDLKLVEPGVPELWVITVDRARRRRFMVVSTRLGNRLDVAEAAKAFVYDGQILLAPGDGLTTADLQTRLGVSPEDVADIRCWPLSL